MSVKIGINGFGRIGKLAFKAGIDDPEVEFVAINHPSLTPEYAAYMLKYDTVHGRWDADITWDENSITVNGKKTMVFNCEKPGDIPWGSVGAEYILESTGQVPHQGKGHGPHPGRGQEGGHVRLFQG